MELRPTIFLPISAVAAFSLFFAGCNTSSQSSRYPITPTGMAKMLETGTVVDVREVVIDGGSGSIGRYGGTVAGGAVGRQAGADLSGTSVGTAVGAAGGTIAGAVIGPQIEKAMTSKRAQELTVRMDAGDLIVVVQELQKPIFNIGDPVKVDTSLAGAARVYHAADDPLIDPDTGAYLPDDFELPGQ